MATTIPSGWSQRTNKNEYEAILDLGNFEKYEINVNVQTGQRQIYTIDPIFRTREFVGTINSNGSIIKQDAWNNIERLQNGSTRLKKIVDSSKIAANKIVGSVGTEEQKRRLAEEKEFSSLKNSQPAPPDRNPNAPDSGSNPSNSGGPGGPGGPGGTGESLTFVNNLSEYGSNKKYPSIIRYPANVNLRQDYMMISQFKYVVPEVFSSGFDSANTSEILSNKSLSSRQFKDSKGAVILPMPSNISEANETGWGSNELSTLSAAALATGVGLVGNITDLDFAGVKSNLGQGLQGVRGAAASKAIVDLATLNAGASIVSKFGLNVDPAAFRSRATGTVVNPNLELLFQGPKLRSFQFQIKMTPRSQEEANNIRRIIKFFKKGMAAQRSNTAETSFFLGAPNVFQIKFMSNGNELRSITQIKTCALTNFTVDYTADGFYSAYEDQSANGSQPIATNITMSFSELTPIYEDNYAIDDHVGFGDNVDLNSLDSSNFKATGESPNNPTNPTNPNNPNNPGSSRPSAGGASAPASLSTRVFQRGGSTAVPGLDDRRGYQPGTDFGFGVRGI